MQIVDRAFLQAHKAGTGSWTRKQLEILGVAWPPVKGWTHQTYGKKLTKAQVEAFIAAKGGEKNLNQLDLFGG